MSDWVYKPITAHRMARLANLILGTGTRDFVTALQRWDEKELAEVLSLLIDKPPEWVEANFRLGDACCVVYQYATETDFGKMYNEALRSLKLAEAILGTEDNGSD